MGKEGFIERLKGNVTQERAQREQPSIGRLGAKEPKVIISTVTRQFKIKEDELTGKRPAKRDCRAVVKEMIYRHGNKGQVEIGQALGGLDSSTVSRERKRLREKIQIDQQLARAVSQIEERLRLR